MSPKTITMSFLASSMKDRMTGVDNKGDVVVDKYQGNRVTVVGTVSEVKLSHRSPSISVEDSKVLFKLAPGQNIPKAPTCQFIELRFDEHAAVGDFRLGDSWEIVLTDTGELVAVHHAPGSVTP